VQQAAEHGALPEASPELTHNSQVTSSVSKMGPLASSNGDADVTQLFQVPQQSSRKTDGENGLTLQFTESLKGQLAEAPIVPRDQGEHRRSGQGAVNRSAKAKDEEIKAAIESAAAACDTAITANRFDQCLHSLDDLEKQHPGHGTIAAARTACESKRARKATQLLRGAVQTAQNHLRNDSAKRAEDALREVEYASQYAALNVRDHWKQLKAACETPRRAKQPAPKIALPVKRRRIGLHAALCVTVAGALLAIGQISHRWRPWSPQPKPVVVNAPASASMTSVSHSTDMEINASPWAIVVSVQDGAGKNIALPAGDSTTPLRLDVVESGTYEVTLRGPDDKEQTVECRVSASDHLCSADMGSPSVKQLLMGEQR
jgi:serine/threonine-protein kinase